MAFRIRSGASAVAVLAILAACSSGPWRSDETWTFALTIDAAEDWYGASAKPCLPRSEPNLFHGDVDDLWIVGVLALPLVLSIALDLALLPVTCAHDLVVE